MGGGGGRCFHVDFQSVSKHENGPGVALHHISLRNIMTNAASSRGRRHEAVQKNLPVSESRTSRNGQQHDVFLSSRITKTPASKVKAERYVPHCRAWCTVQCLTGGGSAISHAHSVAGRSGGNHLHSKVRYLSAPRHSKTHL